jgi:signal transduction histidine kinase
MDMHSDDLIRMNKVVRHRLRNSASGLKSSITFLSKELAERLSPPEMEYFPLILNECDAITHITDRLQLLFDPVRPSAQCPLDDILSDTFKAVRDQFPTAALRIECQTDPAQVTLAECTPVSTLLYDLILNAVEAAPQKECVLTVETTNDALILAIHNDGGELTDKEHDPFLPFFTTRTRHLGIGLNIARKMAELLSGTLALANTTEGVTATVTMPLNPETGWYGSRKPNS